ncbi:hypothetical protein N7490_005201 [Penicillium lividum]|nr:hypothetical protein N7490_005201 [Penicillium lividum]
MDFENSNDLWATVYQLPSFHNDEILATTVNNHVYDESVSSDTWHNNMTGQDALAPNAFYQNLPHVTNISQDVSEPFSGDSHEPPTSSSGKSLKFQEFHNLYADTFPMVANANDVFPPATDSNANKGNSPTTCYHKQEASPPNNGLTNFETRFDCLQSNMERRFQGFETRFNSLQSNMERRFQGIETRFENLQSEMERRFDSLQSNMEQLTDAVVSTSKNVKSFDEYLKEIIRREKEVMKEFLQRE